MLKPTHEPRATAYVPQIVAMIGKLVDNGHAYVSPSGDVLYSVAKFDGYGKLSGRALEDLRAGARVAVEPSPDGVPGFRVLTGAHPEGRAGAP